MSKILVIHTGGTIGCRETVDGLKPYGHGDFEPVFNEVRQGFDAQFVEFEKLIDSSQVIVSDWAKISKRIYDSYHDYDGFVVLHGTDTMSEAACHLSFMLENLNNPVVLTGSQKPLRKNPGEELDAESARNLRNALQAASDGKINEVAVCFYNQIIRGTRAYKYSAVSEDAFRSTGIPPLASIEGHKICYNTEVPAKPFQETACFRVVPFEVMPVSMIYTEPGMNELYDHQLLAKKLKEAYSVAMIMGYGNGNVPDSPQVREALRAHQEKNSIIIVGSQCPDAQVDFRYAAGSWTSEFDVIATGDMMPAAVRAKISYLAWLFEQPSHGFESVNYSPKALADLYAVRYFLQQNIVGELSEQFVPDLDPPKGWENLTHA